MTSSDARGEEGTRLAGAPEHLNFERGAALPLTAASPLSSGWVRINKLNTKHGFIDDNYITFAGGIALHQCAAVCGFASAPSRKGTAWMCYMLHVRKHAYMPEMPVCSHARKTHAPRGRLGLSAGVLHAT